LSSSTEFEENRKAQQQLSQDERILVEVQATIAWVTRMKALIDQLESSPTAVATDRQEKSSISSTSTTLSDVLGEESFCDLQVSSLRYY
jgi:hypothetical protein